MSTGLPTQPGANYGCLEQGWKYGPTNYCYKYFSNVYDAKTFDEAKFACKDLKADLVEVYSEYENQFLVSLLKTRDYQADSMPSQRDISCPATWSMGPGAKCYKATGEKYNDWTMSQNACKRIGGSLAKITDVNEIGFLGTLSN